MPGEAAAHEARAPRAEVVFDVEKAEEGEAEGESPTRLLPGYRALLDR